jgi:hypothetical protein
MENNNRKTLDDIEKELSVGNFAKQEARTLGLTFGGAGAGYLAGLGAVKAGLGKLIVNKYGEQTPLIIKTGGAMIGLIIGSIASQYEHWKKVERERKGVEEINKDVAMVMEKRAQFEDTLDKQSAIIKNIIAERGNPAKSTMEEKIAAERRQAANGEHARMA